MHQQLLNLAVILSIGLVVLAIGRTSLSTLIPQQNLNRLTGLFVGLTTVAFLSPSFWLYAGALIITLVVQAQAAPTGESPSAWRATLWLWLLMVVPCIPVMLPGFAGINNFLELSHVRLLSWLLLTPIIWQSLTENKTTRTGQATTPHLLDKCFIAYFLAQSLVLLLFYDVNFTVWLRQMVEWFTDFGLPYWAMSRAFSKPEQIKRGLSALAVMGIIMAVVGVLELGKTWALYEAVENAWGVNWALSIFLLRDGHLRAQASSGHSLVFAFQMAICLGFWLWLRRFTAKPIIAWLGVLILLLGVGAALSRATWLTVAFMLLISTALSGRIRNMLLVGGIIAGAFVALASFVPSFQELLDKLPIIGTPGAPDVEKEYRQRLLEISLDLIAENPWFGVPNALSQMEEMRQGQGIIDIVNSYIGIALAYGLAGLIPFVGLFLISIWRMWKLRQKLPKAHEGWHLANTMIVIIVTIMVLIFSCSSIATIPFIYFALIGLVVSIERAYANPAADAPLPRAIVPRGIWTMPR
jgi:O-antigen ligase